ncbi:hypothetical protein GOP47_0005748 [Adiantum capillus-veneris]|uniref:Uncharacterized protein n=1 Tax=Adiantum capillus-veneris TaxID=13818 RepID=A0A9D4V653_ADICA|nr:hypothetical protein GOP47_0005748 [Adiantum capillus-veneris]
MVPVPLLLTSSLSAADGKDPSASSSWSLLKLSFPASVRRATLVEMARKDTRPTTWHVGWPLRLESGMSLIKLATAMVMPSYKHRHCHREREREREREFGRIGGCHRDERGGEGRGRFGPAE